MNSLRILVALDPAPQAALSFSNREYLKKIWSLDNDTFRKVSLSRHDSAFQISPPLGKVNNGNALAFPLSFAEEVRFADYISRYFSPSENRDRKVFRIPHAGKQLPALLRPTKNCTTVQNFVRAVCSEQNLNIFEENLEEET